ncbi:MAG: hypothetical protein WB780_18135 [Candidatus Acidiferrales bacterium]
MTATSLSKRISRTSTSAALSLVITLSVALASAPTARAGGDGRIHWKLLSDAQLKLDGKPPLTWSVYQPEKSQKKNNLVLILLGHRYLALDFKAKLVYQVLPTDLEPQGTDFESGDLFVAERLLPADSWTVRDVGPAEQIKVTLKDYGRELEVMLRHPPDMRKFY